MDTGKIVAKILSCGRPSHDKLVEYAVKGHGFYSDSGYCGITYPDDLDDNDRTNGYTIPEGMLELVYRDDEIESG